MNLNLATYRDAKTQQSFKLRYKIPQSTIAKTNLAVFLEQSPQAFILHIPEIADVQLGRRGSGFLGRDGTDALGDLVVLGRGQHLFDGVRNFFLRHVDENKDWALQGAKR